MKSKTTITGAIAALLMAIDPILHTIESGVLTTMDITRMITAGAIALIGYFSADTVKK